MTQNSESYQHEHSQPYFREAELLTSTSFEVILVKKMEDLSQALLREDAEVVLSRDMALTNKLETLIKNVEILQELTDPNIAIFIVRLGFRQNEISQFICIARSQEEVFQHRHHFERFNSYIKDRQENYSVKGKARENFRGECHHIHVGTLTTKIDGESVCDLTVGDYHSLLPVDSIFFDRHGEWDHEIAITQDEGTNQELVVDLTIGDDGFSPTGVYKTPNGTIFSSNDFRDIQLTEEIVADLEQAKPYPSPVIGVILIDELGKTIADHEKIDQAVIKKKWQKHLPQNPAIATVIYARTWMEMRNDSKAIGQQFHSHHSLHRNIEDLK